MLNDLFIPKSFFFFKLNPINKMLYSSQKGLSDMFPIIHTNAHKKLVQFNLIWFLLINNLSTKFVFTTICHIAPRFEFSFMRFFFSASLLYSLFFIVLSRWNFPFAQTADCYTMRAHPIFTITYIHLILIFPAFSRSHVNFFFIPQLTFMPNSILFLLRVWMISIATRK